MPRRRPQHGGPSRPSDAVNDLMNMIGDHQRIRISDPTPPRTIPFDDFRQEVRKYPPSALLPALATLALVQGDETPRPTDLILSVPPWAIALAARESVLWGNEFRSKDVNAESLRRILQAHNEISAQVPSPGKTTSLDVLHLLTRLAYEQFTYQESIFEEISRAQSLLVDGPREIDVDVLNDDLWKNVLGAPLGEIIGATFVLQVMANKNNGWLDIAWIDGHEQLAEAVYSVWPREVMVHRLADLTSTFDEFKAAYERVPHPPPGHERYAYNPLVRTPILRMPNGALLAPQPQLIMPTVSPASLYYRGIEHHDQAFSRDYGRLTEHYVGKQLCSIDPAAVVHPEVTYREAKQEIKSVDWFLALPSALVMIEVKSARFGLLERAAVGGYETRIRELIGKATDQLRRSAAELDASNPNFSHLPAALPRIGIIVTAEPFHLANSPMMRDLLDTAPFPTMVASLRDIEFVAALHLREVEEQLVQIAHDLERSTWSLGNALDVPTEGRRSSVLEAAWQSLPWPDLLKDRSED